jgi:hypothetical protein
MKKIATLILFIAGTFIGKPVSHAQVSVNIEIAPPPIPEYEQPPCPVDGYLWTPGYWGYGPAGYFWIPGAWLLPAEEGYLWTPGYWGYERGYYRFHGGYWGVHYGYGYDGDGYYGGRWEGRNFRYNTAVSNVDRRTVHNTYEDRSVSNSRRSGGSSYYGPRGTNAQPSESHRTAAGERHSAPTRVQQFHENSARRDVNQRATVNYGRPAGPARSAPSRQQQPQQQQQQQQHQQQQHGGGNSRHR